MLHAEIVDANIESLKQPNTSAPEINYVDKRARIKPAKPETSNSKKYNNICRKCGKQPKHKFSDCEAVKSTCKGCGIKGHWIAVCKKSKNINELEPDLTIDIIDTISVPRCLPRFANILINGKCIRFKVDTGASETVISPELQKELQLPEPKPAKEKLYGPCNIILPGRGICKDIALKWENKKRTTNIYVLEGQKTPLLIFIWGMGCNRNMAHL